MTTISNEDALRPYLPHIEKLCEGKEQGLREKAIQMTLDGIDRGIAPFYMGEFAAGSAAMDMAGDAGLGGDYSITNEQREVLDDLLFLTGSLPWTSEMSAEFAAMWYGVDFPAP